MKSMMTKSLTVAFVLALVCPVFAQPLADRVPADAVAYFGWRGAGVMPSGYENTHLKAILDNSTLREFVTEFIPQAIARANGPRAGLGPVMAGRLILNQLWNKPTAIYFGGIDLTNPRDPMPKVALICQAGADAPAMRQQIQSLLAGMRNSPVMVSEAAGVVVVTIGYAQPALALAESNNSLARSPAFLAAMKQVQADPMVACYADVEKALANVESLVATTNNPQVQARMPRVIEVLGLRGLKRIIGTSGFDGRDWLTQSFVEAPAPRTGLLQLLDSQPISPELLKSIPGDSTFAASARFDAAKLITLIRTAAGQIDPQAQVMFDQGLGAVQIALARNLVTDILEPLGQDWGIYCSPTVAGNGVFGVVVVNRLDDPAKAQMALPMAAVNVNNWASILMRRFGAPVEITGRSMEIGGQRIYYIGSPLIAPAWTIKDGSLYLGLFPQPVAAGARWSERKVKSIVENEKFIAIQKRLGVTHPTSFSYYDLETTATQTGIYQQLMVVARYAGIGDLFGVPLPEPLVPPLDVLSQHLGPAGSFAWVDDAGYHVKGISPFPGSRMLNEPGVLAGGGVAMTGTMLSIMLPSLNRARETANRVKCAANLKSIGQGMLLFANENRGRYPQTLGELIKTQELTIEVFICPSAGSSIPDDVRRQGADAQAVWVDGNSDYVYMGRGKTSRVGAEEILVYEKSNDHDSQGINILFGDGHVEFVLMTQAMQMIERQGAK